MLIYLCFFVGCVFTLLTLFTCCEKKNLHQCSLFSRQKLKHSAFLCTFADESDEKSRNNRHIGVYLSVHDGAGRGLQEDVEAGATGREGDNAGRGESQGQQAALRHQGPQQTQPHRLCTNRPEGGRCHPPRLRMQALGQQG